MCIDWQTLAIGGQLKIIDPYVLDTFTCESVAFTSSADSRAVQLNLKKINYTYCITFALLEFSGPSHSPYLLPVIDYLPFAEWTKLSHMLILLCFELWQHVLEHGKTHECSCTISKLLDRLSK